MDNRQKNARTKKSSNEISNVYERNRRMRIKRKKQALAKRFFTLTLILYLFLLLSVLFIISISLQKCEKDEPENSLIVETGNENITFSKKSLYRDGIFYIPISALEELTEIKITGDKNNISFIFSESGEFAKFETGTNKAHVNTNYIELNNNSLISNGELYLPFDFIKEQIQGFDIELDEKSHTYTISLSADTIPQFILKAPSQTEPVPEKGATTVTEEPMDFVLDLSSYEEYMNPSDRDAYLFIVNETNKLTSDYVPENLTGTIFTRNDGRATQKLNKYACLALEAFLKEAEANGMEGISVTSAYRSYDYQNQLFQNEIAATGSAEEAAKEVNPPGISEHQSGLAVDMHNLGSASRAFADTKEAKWLADNAHKFGYILRYPKDKTDITGISYEPWHFRYVGRYHATKMYELGMCLEEYIEYINK